MLYFRAFSSPPEPSSEKICAYKMTVSRGLHQRLAVAAAGRARHRRVRVRAGPGVGAGQRPAVAVLRRRCGTIGRGHVRPTGPQPRRAGRGLRARPAGAALLARQELVGAELGRAGLHAPLPRRQHVRRAARGHHGCHLLDTVRLLSL